MRSFAQRAHESWLVDFAISSGDFTLLSLMFVRDSLYIFYIYIPLRLMHNTNGSYAHNDPIVVHDRDQALIHGRDECC